MRIAHLTLLAALWPLAAGASGVAEGGSGPLRAAYAHVRVVVDGDVARTTVTQVFVNDLPGPVEATYGFPLPDDAVVTGFADWRDGRRIEAGVKGRAAARKAYEAAAAEGRRAALGETEEGHRFRMALFAIPAGGSRRVELRYSQTLAALGGERTFVFPAGDGAPPTVLDVEIEVAADRPIRALETPNHPDARREVLGPARRRVHLSRTRAGLGRDLVVRWRQEATALDLAARSVRPDPDRPGYLEARFAFNADPFPGAREPLDVVLVVDASLSMAGAPLDRARALAADVLDALAPEDRVEVIAFDQRVRPTLGDLAPAGDGVRAVARAALDDLRAGGRSDLQGALDAAAELLRASPRGVVLLMTDGQPTATPGKDPYGLSVDPAAFETTRVVVAHFNYPGRSDDLAALFPNVAVRYVPDGPAAEDALAALARLAVAPAIEDFAFELEGDVYAVHGPMPSRLAVGESVRLMARADGPVKVRIAGRLHGEPVTVEHVVEVPPGPGPDRGLPVEWARLRVRDLEAEWRALQAWDPAAADTVAAEIRGLGLEYRLATRFTSYVATDSLAPDRIKPGDPEIRVYAPPSALAVRGVLPWGEIVRCVWDEDEGLWLGRFLVPRGVPEGLYVVRIFVDDQDGTRYRGRLFFRVDARPPAFELELGADGPYTPGDVVTVRAWPEAEIIEGRDGDRVTPDPVDLKRIVVHVGEWAFPLTRVGDHWEGAVVLDLPPGRHPLRLVAVDYARNASETVVTVEVE